MGANFADPRVGGGGVRVYGLFYKEVVQAVLMCKLDMGVLTPRMVHRMSV